MKTAVGGGGSAHTPELAGGIGQLTSELKISELVLVDPDIARLEAWVR